MAWENGILGFIPEKDWIDVPFNPVRQNDPISALFADTKTNNIVASYQTIASDFQIPAMAQFHAFDTEANTTYRAPIDTRSVEKGLIKTKINQSELFREYVKAGVVAETDQYRYIVRDGFNLGEQIITRTYVAKNELLFSGKVTIKENNLDLTIDYGVKDEQTNFTVDLSPEADAVEQISNIIEAAREAGVQLNGMILASKTLAKMRTNRSMQIAVNGTNAAGATLRNTQITNFLADEFGLTDVITNDNLYNINNNKLGADGRPIVETKRYYPDNKITFFAKSPNGKLGAGLWGDPPEVTNRLIRTTGSDGVSPYVYISQYTENDPAVLWTKASALFIPVLYNPSSLYIATVTEDGA